MRPHFAHAAVLLGGLAACGGTDEGPVTPPLPWNAEAFPAIVEPADNPSTPAKVELGRLLFYDPILSSDRKVACATCHSEIWGMSDGLSVSVGIEGKGPTGPGRDGPNKTTRNSQTLWNAAYRQTMFWDGRSASLEEQALLPIENEVELNRDPQEVIVDLRGIEGYRTLFAEAFPGESEPVTTDNLARALASFQRTFITDLSPYDRYVAGDEGALRPRAVEGMFLFAEAGCHNCHAPPLFERPGFAGRGIMSDDAGRFEVTGLESDRGTFAIPTLRNLRETEPYFHDGSVDTLEEAVAVEVDKAVALGESRAMTADEVETIAYFLNKALMDRSREPDRPEEVPSGLEVPIDGFRVPR